MEGEALIKGVGLNKKDGVEMIGECDQHMQEIDLRLKMVTCRTDEYDMI